MIKLRKMLYISQSAFLQDNFNLFESTNSAHLINIIIFKLINLVYFSKLK